MKNLFEKKKISLWRKIYLNWKFDWRYIPSNIYQGTRNLIRWFPIIWKDRDWASSHIFEILKTKFKHQSKYIGDRDFRERAKRDAEVMMLCVRLIDKVQDEYYEGEYLDYHECDYNWLPVKEDWVDDDGTVTPKSELSELDIVELTEHFDDYFDKYPRIYKQVMNATDNIFPIDEKKTIAMNIAHINHARANKLLFKIMEENIRKWWD